MTIASQILQPLFSGEMFRPKQQQFLAESDAALAGSTPAKYILYGGAMAGGKSHLLRWGIARRLVLLYQKYGVRNLPAMLACEDYPSLKDRQLGAIEDEFPNELGTFYGNHRTHGACYILRPELGGGVILFRNLDKPSKYKSAQFVLIAVDELTQNLLATFDFLRMRLRYPGIPDHECQFWGATNPEGRGLGWVKQLWIDRDFPPEYIEPDDVRHLFVYVKALASDNPHIDPAYLQFLNTLPEPLRSAMRDGSWEVFAGQAFPEFSKQHHVLAPHMPPPGAPLLWSFDYGFGAPFSCGWWYVDYDDTLVRFSEWYGWNGTANKGLHLADSDIALGIKEHEERLGIWGREIQRYAGHDSFAATPNRKDGGQGESTEDVFARHGIHLEDRRFPDRLQKIRQFHEMLRIPRKTDGTQGRPKLQVTSNCEHFIRTIPNLVTDPIKIEDIAPHQEDHVYDEACQVIMSNRLAAERPKQAKSDVQKMWDKLRNNEEDEANVLVMRG